MVYGPNNKCDITGISIIVISISIILTIIYKYLSLGCTSTSKRKKKSLLNIYKLIQADSVPFINLFFLKIQVFRIIILINISNLVYIGNKK
ncbi:hypothetical protein YYG_03844, partial [Plasmodium vinckei petteri]